jgi:hypothetical protein
MSSHTWLFVLFLHYRSWYILIVSFAIFPLTYVLSFGCKFILVGTDDATPVSTQAFGVFNAAIYDLGSIGQEFLGCVDYSEYWREQTNDIAVRGARFAGGFLLAFTTLATIINLCLQCFNKHGKSFLWGVMRSCYLGALLSQGAMYSIFSSDICSNVGGESSSCRLGQNGVAGVFNFALLVGMVIATFNSYPPRNPVFQCWTGQHDSDDSVNSSGSVDVESARERDTPSRCDGSVSLFGNSRTQSRAVSRHSSQKSGSRKSGSKKSAVSKKSKMSVVSENPSKVRSTSRGISAESNLTENATEEEERMSATEEHPDEVDIEAAASAGPFANAGENDTHSRAPSFRENIAKKFWGGHKGKQKQHRVTSEGSFKGVAERVSKLEKGLHYNKKTRALTIGPEQAPTPKSVVEGRPYDEAETEASIVKAKEYPIDPEDSESIKFLRDLKAVTKLGKGGIRVKTIEKGHIVEIYDEYPAKAGEGMNAPHNTDGADLVKVRTEYYDQGSRTTKEVMHHDGSRTVVTTINSIPGDKTEGDSISTKEKPLHNDNASKPEGDSVRSEGKRSQSSKNH